MIEPVEKDGFAAGACDEPGRLIVTFSGSTEIDTRPLLDRFLLQVHAEACRRGVHEVTVDLRDARFVNSACLKALAGWIMTVTTTERAVYRIGFLTSKSHAWQRRSLAALVSIAPHTVSISGA